MTDTDIIEFGEKSTKLDVKEEFYIYKYYKKEPTKIINKMQYKTNVIFEKILKLESKN
jgi:hypothetical protein